MTEKPTSHNLSGLEKEWQLDALLDRIVEVCTISETAQRVMELTRAGEADLTAVVDALLKDPALTTEILSLANSPLFGQRHEVTDIRRAVMVVGMQELHNMASAVAMMAAFSTPEELSLELRASSVLSAATARLLAKALGVDESDAFLCGLLCDIGAMACVAVDSAGYNEIWRKAGSDYTVRAKLEEDHYKARSEMIGAKVLLYNRLPQRIAEAVQGELSDHDDALSRITLFARRAAPIISRAAKDEDADLFNQKIPAFAKALGLGGIDTDKLFRICIDAATTAELSLRGEIVLLESEDQGTIDEEARILDPAARQIQEIAESSAASRHTSKQADRPAYSFRFGTKKD